MGEVSTGPNPVSSADEVYRFYLKRFGLDTDGDPVAVALFAFAIVERERVDWVDHCVGALGQQPPDAAAVRDWYRSKPPAYFTEKERYALNWFASFSRSLLAEEIEEGRKTAIRETVGNLGKFWPAFWSGNLIGITSNIAFTLIVVLFVLVVDRDFSFIAWTKSLISGATPTTP